MIQVNVMQGCPEGGHNIILGDIFCNILPNGICCIIKQFDTHPAVSALSSWQHSNTLYYSISALQMVLLHPEI